MSAWPPAGGNWEGGTVHAGRRLYHEPHTGWRDDGPANTSPYLPPPARLTDGHIYRDPRTLRRRSRLARWLHQRRHGVVAATALLVVAGYATTLLIFFERTLPTMRAAAALVAAAIVLVALLLAVVIWARRD